VLLCLSVALAAKSYEKIQVFGNLTIRHYFIEIMVGTPPQKQRMHIDTGSHLATLKCSQCENCQPTAYEKYSPEKSSSSRKVLCVRMR
jgi:hypothetical protein